MDNESQEPISFSFEYPTPSSESIEAFAKMREHGNSFFITDGDMPYPYDPQDWPRPSLIRRVWLRFNLRVIHRAKQRLGYYRLRRRAYWTFTERGTLWGRPYWWMKRKGWIKSRPGFYPGIVAPYTYSDHDYGS